MKTLHYTRKSLARLTNMNESNLCKKLNGLVPFKTSDIVLLCQALRIPREMIGQYFFPYTHEEQKEILRIFWRQILESKDCSMCKEWAQSFQNFYSWCLANGYEPGRTLELLDPEKPYAPGKCGWERYHFYDLATMPYFPLDGGGGG